MTLLKIENVKRVYSGKPGCGCGCRGEYWEDAKNIKRIVNKINKALADGSAEEYFKDSLSEANINLGDVAAVIGGRYYWAYPTLD